MPLMKKGCQINVPGNSWFVTKTRAFLNQKVYEQHSCLFVAI